MLPEIHRVLEGLRDVVILDGRQCAIGRNLAEHKAGCVPGTQLKFRHSVAVVDLDLHAGVQAQDDVSRLLLPEDDLPVALFHRVRRAAIIKARSADHSKGDFASHYLQPAHQGVPGTGAVQRHEIRKRCQTVGGKETGQQDVGVRQIHLPGMEVLGHRGNLEMAPFFVVQQRRKNGR